MSTAITIPGALLAAFALALALAQQDPEGARPSPPADIRTIASSVETRLERTVPERAFFAAAVRSGDVEPVETWIAGLPTVTVDGELHWIAEGDLLLNAAGLTEYAYRREVEATARFVREVAGRIDERTELQHPAGEHRDAQTTGLLAGTTGAQSRLIRWRPGVVLTYRVARATFPTADAYQRLVVEMDLATKAWEELCGVDFQHRQELDGRDGIEAHGSKFVVRYLPSAGTDGRLIASAFFPTDSPGKRRVLVTPRFFDTDFDSVGVLRHELGHVLGFRHEHIRSGAPPDCPKEGVEGVLDLTEYDPQSVMHYFCGGVGDKSLRFTDLDRVGARALYGLPLTQLELVD